MQNNDIKPLPHTVHKSQLKWIIDLNAKIETIKLPEDNIEGTLCDLDLDKDYLNMTLKVQ